MSIERRYTISPMDVILLHIHSVLPVPFLSLFSPFNILAISWQTEATHRILSPRTVCIRASSRCRSWPGQRNTCSDVPYRGTPVAVETPGSEVLIWIARSSGRSRRPGDKRVCQAQNSRDHRAPTTQTMTRTTMIMPAVRVALF